MLDSEQMTLAQVHRRLTAIAAGVLVTLSTLFISAMLALTPDDA